VHRASNSMILKYVSYISQDRFEKCCFVFLLFTSLLGKIVESQFNLYDTDHTANSNPLQSDCLRVYERRKIFSSSNFDYIIHRITQYCLRPIDVNNLPAEETLNSRDPNSIETT
jgi:hypothetical protein